MSTKTTLRERLAVAELIQEKPNITNKGIQRQVNITGGGIAGVKKWIKQKGVNQYVEFLRNKLIEEKKQHIQGEFTNKDGEGKGVSRRTMAMHIGRSGLRKGKVLTLPHIHWTMESLLQDTVSKVFKYVAVENNLNVFPQMAAKVTDFGRGSEVYYGDIAGKIYAAQEDEFSHLILDYCGTLETFRKEIIHACLNNIVKVGGTISVTVQKARTNSVCVEKTINLKSKWTGEYLKETDNTHFIGTFFDMLSAMTDFEVVDKVQYGDGSPMMLVVIKRTS